MRRGDLGSFLISLALTCGIWALSKPLFDAPEAWDVPLYYFPALFACGAISGWLAPTSLRGHFAGALVGQGGYAVMFLKGGPLWILGVVFLVVFSAIFMGTAAFTGQLRQNRKQKAT